MFGLNRAQYASHTSREKRMKLEWEVDSAVDCNYLLYKHVVLSEISAIVLVINIFCWNIRSRVASSTLGRNGSGMKGQLYQVSEGNFTVGGARKTYIY